MQLLVRLPDPDPLTCFFFFVFIQLDDWVLCRIHKKSNDFHQLSSSEQEQQEGSSTVEQESPKSESVEHEHEHDPFQFHHQRLAMTKSCSLTDLLNSIDYSALSQILDGPPVDGSEAVLPQQSPLIYPTMTTQTHQALNYNNNNLNLPHTNAASSEFVVANNCNNGVNVNKRKRMVISSAAMNDGAAESLDDGSNGFGRKLMKVLPSDSTNHFGSSSYCNQQVVDTSGLFQYSSLLNYPFLEMQ